MLARSIPVFIVSSALLFHCSLQTEEKSNHAPVRTRAVQEQPGPKSTCDFVYAEEVTSFEVKLILFSSEKWAGACDPEFVTMLQYHCLLFPGSGAPLSWVGGIEGEVTVAGKPDQVCEHHFVTRSYGCIIPALRCLADPDAVLPDGCFPVSLRASSSLD